jgi:hypothetical protein
LKRGEPLKSRDALMLLLLSLKERANPKDDKQKQVFDKELHLGMENHFSSEHIFNHIG